MQRTLKQTRRKLKQSRKSGTRPEPPSGEHNASVLRWTTLAKLCRRYMGEQEAGDSSKLGEGHTAT